MKKSGRHPDRQHGIRAGQVLHNIELRMAEHQHFTQGCFDVEVAFCIGEGNVVFSFGLHVDAGEGFAVFICHDAPDVMG